MRAETVNSWKINQRQIAAIDPGQFAVVLFHSDARIVRDLLAQPGQAIEERRFSGIRRPDKCDRPNLSRYARSRYDLDRGRRAAVAHRDPSSDSRTEIHCAVSRRRATSIPSIAYTVGAPAGARRIARTKASGINPMCIRWC